MNTADTHYARTVFVGGGNMATAILGGLLKKGLSTPEQILVIDPNESQRERLEQEYGVQTRSRADEAAGHAQTVVWAIKPQVFHEVALATRFFLPAASPLHISVAAGIKAQHIASWLGTERVVRVMPNTPALVGQGMTGMFAMGAVSGTDRDEAKRLLGAVGQTLWVETEVALDGLAGVSGSGPAYVFYLIEAMEQAAQELGFTPEQAKQMVVATVSGAAALAAQSSETAATLRERVTSKGGMTHEAIVHMEANHVKHNVVEAIHKAVKRGIEMGREFGG